MKPIRAQFVGRNRETQPAVSIVDGHAAGQNSRARCSIPIVSLRRTIRIPPGTTARVIFSTMVASSREQAIDWRTSIATPAPSNAR